MITHVSACWNSLNRQLEGKLGSWNPAKAVDQTCSQPKRERLDEGILAELRSRVSDDAHPDPAKTGSCSPRSTTACARKTSGRFALGARRSRAPTLHSAGSERRQGRRIPDSPVERRPSRSCSGAKDDNATIAIFAPFGGDLRLRVSRALNARQQGHGDRRPLRQADATVTDTKHARFRRRGRAHATGARGNRSRTKRASSSWISTCCRADFQYNSHNVNATYIGQHLDHLADVRGRRSTRASSASSSPPEPVATKPKRGKKFWQSPSSGMRSRRKVARTLALAGIVVVAVIQDARVRVSLQSELRRFHHESRRTRLDLSTMTDATVSLCLNARCISGTFATVPSSMDDMWC